MAYAGPGVRLAGAEGEFLTRLQRNLSMAADLSRADVTLSVPMQGRFRVIAHARPHSMTPIHSATLVGTYLVFAEEERISRVMSTGRATSEEVARWGNAAPLLRQMRPVRSPAGEVVAVATIEKNLIEHERHRRRSPQFQRALELWLTQAFKEEIPGVTDLIPFGEQDGIVYVDAQRRVRYISGIATNFYRRLGYVDQLVGRHLDALEPGDGELVAGVLAEGRCYRGEAAGQGREWVRQALPVMEQQGRYLAGRRFPVGRERGDRIVGVLLLVHDETEARRRQRELQVKSAMIQETHHRVKNNLQTIAALLRMEARRTNSVEARQVLQESMNRILSISVVHEFMANQGDNPINLREVGQKVITHLRQMVAYPDRQVTLSISGPDIYLLAQQATVCSLVMNELLQNALEHGFKDRTRGSVTLQLSETDDRVVVEVRDDGVGLDADFDLSRSTSMGLNIVQVLVRDDLKGEVSLVSDDGVRATVSFPRIKQEVHQYGTDTSINR